MKNAILSHSFFIYLSIHFVMGLGGEGFLYISFSSFNSFDLEVWNYLTRIFFSRQIDTRSWRNSIRH